MLTVTVTHRRLRAGSRSSVPQSRRRVRHGRRGDRRGRGPEPDRARAQGAAVGRRRVRSCSSSLMRLCLVPEGARRAWTRATARSAAITRRADATRAAAQGEVAEYEAALAAVRAEATARDRCRPRRARGRARRRVWPRPTRRSPRGAAAAAAEAEAARAGGTRQIEDGRRRRRQPRRRAGHRPARPTTAAVRRIVGRGAERGRCARDARGIVMLAAEEHIDQTHSWIWPEGYEMLFGIAGLDHRSSAAVLEGRPDSSRRRWRTAPHEIQAELDDAEPADDGADAEAARSARRKGDIECRARPPARRGRRAGRGAARPTAGPGSSARSPSSRPRPTPTSPPLASRGVDELRAEIARLSAAAADHVVDGHARRRRPSSDLIEELHRRRSAPRRSGQRMSDSAHRRLRPGPVRDRPRRGHARRGRGRAVPLRPQPTRPATSCASRSPTS